jgi:hypothetical protein
LRSPTGSAFAAAALALLEAEEAEDPLAALPPLVAVAPVVGVELVPPVAVAVAAGPLHTMDLGTLGEADATDVGVEKENGDTFEAEGMDRGVYVPVTGDVVNG